MSISFKFLVKGTILPLCTVYTCLSFAQTSAINKNPNAILQHGIEQYQNGNFNLAANTLIEFLEYDKAAADNAVIPTPNLDREQAMYYKALAGVKLRDQQLIAHAVDYINTTSNEHNKQRVAYELAKYYLEDNRDLQSAIYYYELAGVANLSNAEIADAKFELGYAYFITQDFVKARNLFVGIKEIQANKYYVPANYYYGLLSYKEGKLEEALASFKRVRNAEEYKDIIPYYEAEIFYFKGEYEKVLDHSRKYLNKKGTLYYDKEMRLLTGQTLFEMKRYADALPYFEDYYENSEKIRKEELYELGFTYYQLKRYADAIDKFQPLSNSDDVIGQTSMYLLGDCYLKTGDKKGARNAFGLAAEMDYDAKQKEAATFLYSKLSYEQGFDQIAARGFRSFIDEYPRSASVPEAKSLLSTLLLKANNYGEAYELLRDEVNKDATAWTTYQKAAVGRGMQLMQNKDYTEAEAILLASLQNPVNPSLEAVAYFWRGEIAYQQDRHQDAISNLKAFISKSKGYEEAIKRVSNKATLQNANITLGYASLKANNFNEAATAFSEAQASSGDNADLAKEAVLRQADASFMQKDFDAALRLYDKAIANNVGDADYARFQKALILGLQNKTADKIALLRFVAQKNDSKMRDDARLELAAEYINNEQYSDAITLLKQLEEKQTDISLKTKAAYLLAYAHQEAGQKEPATKAYKHYIANYPTGADRKLAIAALSTLYSNHPEEYEAFLKRENISEVSSDEVETVFYDAADNEFSEGNYQKAIDAYKKYLDKYPNGNYKIQSNYFMGESYFQLKNYTASKAAFDKVLNNNWNDYSADAAKRVAQMQLAEKDYAGAKASYNRLLENNDEKSTASTYEGMMKISFEEEDYEGTKTWADMLSAVGTASPDAKLNARFYKAKALQIEGQLEDAKSIYQQLDKENVGNISAEARYQIAVILFNQKRNDAAEKAASYAAQASNNSPYWAAKNYILLADILTDNKDYFNAKATLQSIIKNSKDQELVSLAQQKLEQVKALESAKSKISE